MKLGGMPQPLALETLQATLGAPLFAPPAVVQEDRPLPPLRPVPVEEESPVLAALASIRTELVGLRADLASRTWAARRRRGWIMVCRWWRQIWSR